MKTQKARERHRGGEARPGSGQNRGDQADEDRLGTHQTEDIGVVQVAELSGKQHLEEHAYEATR